LKFILFIIFGSAWFKYIFFIRSMVFLGFSALQGRDESSYSFQLVLPMLEV